MSCDCECRFESIDTSLSITFLDGRNQIDAYWESLPRLSESVSVDSLIEGETVSIAGTVTAVQWRQVRGIYGNPHVLIGVDGFDLQSVRVVIEKEHGYHLEWGSVPPQASGPRAPHADSMVAWVAALEELAKTMPDQIEDGAQIHCSGVTFSVERQR